jgi:hypothetical protein
VNTFRRILAFILLVTFCSQISATTELGDMMIEHSLDELPSFNMEEVLPGNPVIPETPVIHETIEIHSFGNDDIQASTSLVAAKNSYEQTTTYPSLAPVMRLPSIVDMMTSHDMFLWNLRQEAIIENLLQTPVDTKIVGLKWKEIRTLRKSRLTGITASFWGNISATLNADTVVKSPRGNMVDSEAIGVGWALGNVELKWKAFHEAEKKKIGTKRKWYAEATPRVFQFWIPGEHLIFSQPVKIEIETPTMTDGNEVELGVLHEGDAEFSTLGLSVSPDTLCNNDGSASIPGNITSSSGGKVTFYTCGASSFTMNPTGWITGSNNLRIVIGDCGQFQLYYNSGANIYTGNPPGTGCNATLDNWIALRIGGTTYGSDWTAWSTNTMTGTTNGNTYTGRTTLTRVVTGRTYTLILDWRYVSPNKFFNIDWSVNIPAWNPNNIRFYMWNDSMVGWTDANDVGYTGSTPSATIGVYDNVLDQLSAIRYLSGIMWTAQQANGYNTVRTRINNGADFTNAIQTTPWDLGFWVNWNLGTTPWTYTWALEWRLSPYTTGSTVDLAPWIWLPEWPLIVNYLSQIPVTVTNGWSISSSGVHTLVLTLPANVNGPGSSFTDNGWSCGAQIGVTVTCSKTTTIASFADDTLRIPVIPTVSASGTTVTFTGVISNSWDSIPTNNSAFASNFVLGALATSPGGVTSPGLWLRANNGTSCSTSGCTITNWANYGSLWAAASGTTASGTVIYSSGSLINGNPTVYFNNGSMNLGNTLAITTSYSIFVVSKIGTNGKFPIGTQTWVANALDWVTTPTYNTFRLWGGANSYSGANGRTANIPHITSAIRTSTGLAQGRTNGFQFNTGTLATAVTASRLRLGGNATASGALAHVSEVIIYNTTITGANLNKVESYLATKYGIPLSQSAATNYTFSNGTIGMNGTTMAWYVNNVAGIARDDTSTLNQRTSQSATNTGDIRVSVGSIGTNLSSMYWGHNNGTINVLTWTDIASGSTRIMREWRFEENNSDLWTVTVSYMSGALPAGFSGTLMMFVDNDGIFATGATYYTGTANTGSNTWDFSINLSDGQYITFWKVPPSDITPPTILTNSLASGSLLPTGRWIITVTYTDTGSAINTSSFSGQIYSWNTGSSTWNVTNLAPTYMTITGTTTTTTGMLSFSGLPSGKYRFDILISDTIGNTETESYTYFIDGVTWSIDSDIYNIWDIIGNTTKFGTWELVVTIQTVWAWFTLTLLPYTPLVSTSTGTINYWNGTVGWGYDLWNGASYSWLITSHSPSANLVTQVANINQSGQKNTYTYRLKYGTLVNVSQNAWNYNWHISFSLNLSY